MFSNVIISRITVITEHYVNHLIKNVFAYSTKGLYLYVLFFILISLVSYRFM